MAICMLHNELDSLCRCSEAYKIGNTLRIKLINANLTLSEFYNLIVENKYCEFDSDFASKLKVSEHDLSEDNRSYALLGRVIEDKKVDVLSIFKKHEQEQEKRSALTGFKEITDTEDLENGKEYISYGTSMGDGHLSDHDFDTWRRVKFENGRFVVVEKEDSTRGYFKVQKVFELPDIK